MTDQSLSQKRSIDHRILHSVLVKIIIGFLLVAGAAGLAIQAGVLLGAVYIYSKNLWLPIALHFAWNFTQSGIYGASTSGNEISKSLITSRIDGSTLITGGIFGPEGSIQATLFCLSAAIIILIICKKQNKIVPPSWLKKDE